MCNGQAESDFPGATLGSHPFFDGEKGSSEPGQEDNGLSASDHAGSGSARKIGLSCHSHHSEAGCGTGFGDGRTEVIRRCSNAVTEAEDNSKEKALARPGLGLHPMLLF